MNTPKPQPFAVLGTVIALCITTIVGLAVGRAEESGKQKSTSQNSPAQTTAVQTTPGDPSESFESLRKSASAGDPTASYRLGLAYRRGASLNPDYKQSVRLFRQAADKGDARAQYQLGYGYESGEGVLQDYAEALRWYRMAAQAGNSAAQYRLGVIFDRESGSKRNVSEATKWYRMAAARGNTDALHALEALHDKPLAATTLARPQFAIATAAQPALPQADQLDRSALAAQQRLATLTLAEAEGSAAAAELQQAENALSAARDAAWNSIAITRDLPLIITGPLAMAMLDLSIEVRRSIGPTIHTKVPGLINDPGCAGDFIADRLLLSYGEALLNHASGFNTSDDGTAELGAITRQTVCLGDAQSEDLEFAVYNGFAVVSGRMKAAGMASMVPAFARLLAPVQLLIVDVRKYQGERSAALWWLKQNAKILESTGWPTSHVFLWDRRAALLAGFPACPPGNLSAGCVSVATLIGSIVDPRAVGLGDCGLAAMIARGPARIGTNARFICPSLPCRGPGGTIQPADLNKLKQTLAERFPDQTQTVPDPQDLNQSFCRDPGDLSTQGGAPQDRCADAIFASAPGNPWDTYAACTVEAATGGDSETFGQLPGVPMGSLQCNVKDPGDGPDRSRIDDIEPVVIKVHVQPNEPPEERVKIRGRVSPSDSLEVRVSVRTENLGDQVYHASFQKNTLPINPAKLSGRDRERIVRATFLALVNGSLGTNYVKSVLDTLENSTLRANDPPAAARSQRDAENAAYPIIEDAVLRGTLSYSDYKGIQTLLRGQFHQDCAGDQCINNCTDLGRQLTQQNACKQQLLTALEMALGKPPRELGGSFPPQGFKAYVDPDQVNLPVAADIGTCIPSLSTPLPQLADACGVALCTDDQLSQATVGGCRCGHDAVTFTPTNRQCVFENWGPDQVPTDNCGKVPRQAPGTIPPGGPPPPVDQ